MSPPTVQELAPENWVTAWDLVCFENDVLVKEWVSRGDMAVGMKEKIQAHGPLLAEILSKRGPAGSSVARIFRKETPVMCAGCGERPAGGRLSSSDNFCCRRCSAHTDPSEPRKHDAGCTKFFMPKPRSAIPPPPPPPLPEWQ